MIDGRSPLPAAFETDGFVLATKLPSDAAMIFKISPFKPKVEFCCGKLVESYPLTLELDSALQSSVV